MRFGFCLNAMVYFLFSCALFVVSCIDLKKQIIPDIISLPGTLVFSLASILILKHNIFYIIQGIAAGSGSLLLFSLGYYLMRKQVGIGGGDIKLMAMIGSLTGFAGALFTILVGSISGSIIGILIILYNRYKKKKLHNMQKIPFGPFLSAGALLYLFYGEELIDWYINLFIVF